MATYLGMRGTGDWSTDERPKNFREGILFDNPNGIAPLTAILSKMSNTKVDDPEYSWWTQEYPTQSTALAPSTGIVNVHKAVDLAAQIDPADAVVNGEVFVATSTTALRDQFKVGHQVVLRNSDRPDRDVNGRITGVSAAVDDSGVYPIGVKLLEAEHSSGTLKDSNIMQVVGNVNEEGSTRPSAQALDPTKHYNYTQIFRTAHEVTRTASKTRLRTKEALAGTRRDSLEFHMMEIEKAFMFGVRSEDTDGTNPMRTTDGIISAIRRNTPANVSDFATNGGGTWDAKGKAFMEDELEKIFRYGDNQKIALCGSGALLGLNRLAGTDADINITPGERSYGIRIQEWVTPFGTLDLLTHPLMSDIASTRNSLLILEPKRLKYRFIDDTTFIQDNLKNRGGSNSVDAYQEEYLTECGLEYSHTRAMGYLTQIGVG